MRQLLLLTFVILWSIPSFAGAPQESEFLKRSAQFIQPANSNLPSPGCDKVNRPVEMYMLANDTQWMKAGSHREIAFNYIFDEIKNQQSKDAMKTEVRALRSCLRVLRAANEDGHQNLLVLSREIQAFEAKNHIAPPVAAAPATTTRRIASRGR